MSSDLKLDYSNFTFELWIILHKTDCNGAKTHRKQYLPELNKAYDEKFEDLQEYKRENDFKRILKKLTIEDVISAVKRAEAIMKRNEKSGYRLANDSCLSHRGKIWWCSTDCFDGRLAAGDATCF